MSAYAFETITSDEALNIQAGDYITLATGPASRAAVRYLPANADQPERIELTIGDRTVVFGQNLSEVTLRRAFEIADSSRLVIGNEGHQSIGGSPLGDALYGGDGHDLILAGSGDDRVQGNAGNDTLHGDAGANTISGGQGDDVINTSAFGETRGSWAHGNKGDDVVIGGAGADTLLGGQGDDLIGGREGADYLSGDLGNDEIFSGSGDDTLIGGAGSDTLNSSDGSDVMTGGDGDDQLIAYGFGHVRLNGGAGDDTLVSACPEQSLLRGGAGHDQFEFAANARPAQPTDDVIVDWESGDRLYFAQVTNHAVQPQQYSEVVSDSYEHALALANAQIANTGAIYVAAQVGGEVIVFVESDGNLADGADVAVILTGRTLADIDAGNFI
jgi:Ca2+-binding RTX toxin-like protein